MQRFHAVARSIRRDSVERRAKIRQVTLLPCRLYGMTAATASAHSISAHDALELDSLLGDEERMIRDTVRRFVGERILPEIGEWFDAGTLPPELAPELGRLGLLGMHLTGYGCAGASATAYGIACRELEAGDSGLRSLVSVQGSLAMFPIWKFGSEEQRTEWLPRMARGEAIGCFGLTEPDHGSDPGAMRTRARRAGADWVLNGTKMWITNGGVAAVAVVWAQTDDGIRGFVVPTDTPGFSTRDIHRKLSLRASITSELILEDVRLPASAVLPEVTGLRGPLSCLNEARYGIAWGAVGAGVACYLSALEYAKTRVQWGRPIAGFQLTQRKLVEMMLELQKAQLVASRLGVLKDAGTLHPHHVSIGKLNNVRAALEIAREARTILGANGITTEYPVMRHANNLESVLTYEGTTEVHTLILGEAITGERAIA
jgi:glutaryl-CoA dehydrogenase